MTTELNYAHLYHVHRIPSDSRSIRVLQIHAPVSDDDDETHSEPIKCHLSIVDLDTEPCYAALSYVWGSYGPFQLSCGDVHIPLTVNCYSALWHLRKKLGAFRVWVDAVCIDQANAEEKEQQLQLMSEIYRSATEVYIWLGKGSVATGKAMAYLAQGGLANQFLRTNKAGIKGSERVRLGYAAWHYYWSRWSAKRSLVPEHRDTLGHKWVWHISPLRNWRIIRGHSIVCVNDLKELLACDWTERIWTYQEVIFASNPVLVSGVSHLPWSQFTYAMIFLGEITEFPALNRWIDIVSSRVYYRSKLEDAAIIESSYLAQDLTEYSEFVEQFQPYYVESCFRIVAPLLGYPIFAITIFWFDVVLAVTFGAVPSFLVLVGTLFAWLSPNPRLSPQRRNRKTNLLVKHPQKGLLNTICRRAATDPRDMSFAILPILELLHAEAVPRLPYTARIEHVYTQLTRYLLDRHQYIDILAMAAEAKCPNAASWVPDFSRSLRPVSGPVRVHRAQRSLDANYVLAESNGGVNAKGTIEPESSYTVQARRLGVVICVSDFLDIMRMPAGLQHGARLHNAYRIMDMTVGDDITGSGAVSLNKKETLLPSTLLWPQLFKEHFTAAAQEMDDERLASYCSTVMHYVDGRKGPERLLRRLEVDGLLDVHDHVCGAFAKSGRVHFLLRVQHPDARASPFGRYFYCTGYVSGLQQQQIQGQDEVFRVKDMRNHVFVRRGQGALVARLNERQSEELSREVEFGHGEYDFLDLELR